MNELLIAILSVLKEMGRALCILVTGVGDKKLN
jgi:hypothetical protein